MESKRCFFRGSLGHIHSWHFCFCWFKPPALVEIYESNQFPIKPKTRRFSILIHGGSRMFETSTPPIIGLIAPQLPMNFWPFIGENPCHSMKKTIGDRGIPLFYPYESMGLAYLPYIYHIFFFGKIYHTLRILAHRTPEDDHQGWTQSPFAKTHRSFRFQETILRFGEPGFLGAYMDQSWGYELMKKVAKLRFSPQDVTVGNSEINKSKRHGCRRDGQKRNLWL